MNIRKIYLEADHFLQVHVLPNIGVILYALFILFCFAMIFFPGSDTALHYDARESLLNY